MIIPLGHDKEIFRFPAFTLGIVVICLGVQLYSCAFTHDDSARIKAVKEERHLRQKIWLTHGQKWARGRSPDLRAPRSLAEARKVAREMQKAKRQFFEEYEAGKIVQRDDQDFRRLAELGKLKNRHSGLLAFAYRPGAPLYTLITYAFIHGGWVHLIGNMLFLYLCGCNMEDRWGPLLWSTLYLGGAVASALLWRAWNPGTQIPLVGASGAIAAAMGAFLITSYKTEIRMFYFFWILFKPIYGTFTMRAYWALPLWILQQLLGMWTEGTINPVAYSAHVGGVALGLGAAILMMMLGVDRRLKVKSAEAATIYTQDPRYLAGLKQLEAGDAAAARQSFEALVSEQPDNLDATLELYRLLDDPVRASRLASSAVLLAKRSGDLDTPISIHADLAQRFPSSPLDARSLFTVAECHHKRSDFRNAVAAYERLVEAHPEAVVVPKAMLNIGEICLTRLNLNEKGHEVLQAVMTHFPGTPFAERAALLIDTTDDGRIDGGMVDQGSPTDMKREKPRGDR